MEEGESRGQVVKFQVSCFGLQELSACHLGSSQMKIKLKDKIRSAIFLLSSQIAFFDRTSYHYHART